MIGSIYGGTWTQSSAAHETDSEPAKLLLQPDITVVIGSFQDVTKFAAHRFVLCNHSAYFRTLLAAYKGPEIRISNIDSRTFASLLDYMYTGRLNLNSLNVYEIFLAGNLLHITDVPDQCRQYLRENHYRSIIKPIPCKRAAIIDAFDTTTKPLKYQPLRINEDASSIFKPVGLGTAAPIKHSQDEGADHTTNENDNPREDKKLLEEKSEDHLTTKKHSKKRAEGSKFNIKQIEKLPGPSSNEVIFDVACCDGPVRFRKVLNKFYNPDRVLLANKSDNQKRSVAPCHGCKHGLENYRRPRKHTNEYDQYQDHDQDQNRNPNDYHSQTKCKQQVTRLNGLVNKPFPSTSTRLENNVPCYSCKICGSKFSSYYFVHKHRKLHHSQTDGS